MSVEDSEATHTETKTFVKPPALNLHLLPLHIPKSLPWDESFCFPENRKRSFSLIEKKQEKSGYSRRRRLYGFLNKLKLVADKSILTSPRLLEQLDCLTTKRCQGPILELNHAPLDPLEIPQAEFTEQLTALHNIIIKLPFKMAQDADFIMQMALNLVKLETSSEIVHRELGMLIFIAEKSTASLLHYMEGNRSKDSFFNWVAFTFNKEISIIKNGINEHYKNHQKTGIQGADLALKVLLTKEIAEILLTSECFVNSSLIELLMESFKDYFSNNDKYTVDMIARLNLLKNNNSLRHSLSKISHSNIKNSISNSIILATFPDSKLTQRDAVLTALSAFLSHLRQGPAGSCFATFLAINLFASRPESCLKDFHALLQDNALTRHVDGIKVQFPFLLRTTGSSLLNPIQLSPHGEIYKEEFLSKATLWEAPGFIAAAKSMGIKDLKSEILTQLERIQKNENVLYEKITITPASLLKNLSTSQENYLLGTLAFEAQVCNPLLHAWENSIAGMAETSEKGMLKFGIISSTLGVISEYLVKNVPDLALDELEHFHSSLNGVLNSAVRLQYDPTIPNAGINSNSHSIVGGFVLFDRNGNNQSEKWLRINSSKDFQNFVIKACQKASQKISENQHSFNYLKMIENYVSSDIFLNENIRNIHPGNQGLSHPLQVSAELKYTPWLIRAGNNPKNTLKVYLETKDSPSTFKFLPLNATSLLEKIIDIAKNCAAHSHNSEGANPFLITPVRTPGLHSFSLMLGHPTLTRAWENEIDLNTWIEQSISAAGLEISSSPIDSKIKTGLLNLCINKLLPHKYSKAFLDLYLKFPEKMTIREYRTHLADALNAVYPRSLTSHNNNLCQLDTALYSFLSSDKQKKLEESAVHFADTNWFEGTHDIHFCFLINPGTGELEIWKANDNGKNLEAVDQTAWLGQQEWEIYDPFFLDKENFQHQS